MDKAAPRGRRLPAGRKADLAAYVAEQGQVTVAELSEHFDVSIDTVRRDLDQLHREGALIRTHGGAVSATDGALRDRGLDVRLRVQVEEKEKIARSAFRDLYVFGGAVRTITQATTGPVTFAMAAGGRELDIRCDLALVAVGAVDESGYSTSNLGDATMMAEMIDRADRTAVLADSSKLGRRLFAQVAPLEGVDYLITDAAPPPPLTSALLQAGVSLVTP
ncbi:DeoR/GlpR family DNA-binding transcription regulator [Microbacterium hominis]|uniref:Transcriptional regulator n=1 Tax=Microbacterium hominis TaxID=162426 RepID=A0A0B4CRR1_9MICO|nr:DeoR/GlpR family DNA-binding transcription regulator [Microbacterium hominis]KIC59117.1 transcriptional regulator [Microbacterium hominis]